MDLVKAKASASVTPARNTHPEPLLRAGLKKRMAGLAGAKPDQSRDITRTRPIAFTSSKKMRSIWKLSSPYAALGVGVGASGTSSTKEAP